ncbi:MAG: hypothetical protein ACXWID_18415 [Pyrinomonadaceae bacterium]
MNLDNALATYQPAEASMVGATYLRPILAKVAVRPNYQSQVVLVGDVLERFRLVQPIVVNLEQADGKIIASDDVFFMYGEGITGLAAVHDYLSSLAEYYELLESYDDAPSVELFSYLQTYLLPRTT